MKQFRFICCMVCMISFAATVRGQQAPHWNCDIHAYQYDMTVYLQLQSKGKAFSDYSDYEIAAFCSEECRGVATILSYKQKNGTTAYVARIRVRSNSLKGDDIEFRTYQHSQNVESTLTTHITFESMSVEGTPSNPLVYGILKGDVNGDGQVGIGDIVAVTNYMAGKTNGIHFNIANVNGDNEVGIGDIVAITNIMAENK